jgi:hypothetical protein
VHPPPLRQIQKPRENDVEHRSKRRGVRACSGSGDSH